MTYSELQQRHDAIVRVLDKMLIPGRAYKLIRALLDDADCDDFAGDEFSIDHYESQFAAYARALSIAEKELGL